MLVKEEGGHPSLVFYGSQGTGEAFWEYSVQGGDHQDAQLPLDGKEVLSRGCLVELNTGSGNHTKPHGDQQQKP